MKTYKTYFIPRLIKSMAHFFSLIVEDERDLEDEEEEEEDDDDDDDDEAEADEDPATADLVVLTVISFV
jgi:hypothetical protein